MPKLRNSQEPAAGGAGGWATQDNSKLLILAAAIVTCLVLDYLLVAPFLPALVWSTAVAVVTHRMWTWLRRRIPTRGVAAGVAVATVALTVLLPIIVLVYFAAAEIVATVQSWQQEDIAGQVQEMLASYPRVADLWRQATENVDLVAVTKEVAGRVQNVAGAVFSGIMYTLVQAALMLFVLFYLYRDQEQVLDSVHQFSPLSDHETSHLLQRLSDTIYATIYGILTVALIQGTLGGIIFALLGVPGATVWGMLMGVLATIPYLGTFVVWGPAALLLAASGQYVKAAILVAWGLLVIGLIDNLLYPMLVGGRLRQHTVVTFIAMIGGLSLFGATGILLGPLLVTLTFALLDIWRRKTPAGPAAA